MTDSREELEADIISFLKTHDGPIPPYWLWLDRQAAITHAECDVEPRDADSDYVKRVCKANKMLQKDRDEWKAKAERYQQKCYKRQCDEFYECQDESCTGWGESDCPYPTRMYSTPHYCEAVLKAVDGE